MHMNIIYEDKHKGISDVHPYIIYKIYHLKYAKLLYRTLHNLTTLIRH